MLIVFQMWNHSKTFILFEWERLNSTYHVIEVEPSAGRIGALHVKICYIEVVGAQITFEHITVVPFFLLQKRMSVLILISSLPEGNQRSLKPAWFARYSISTNLSSCL